MKQPGSRPARQLAWMIAVAFALVACKEEPIFVVKFEPQDLASKTGEGGLATTIAQPRRRGADPAAGCDGDGDCVRVDADCCGCTAGGKAAVMTRKAATVYQGGAAARCAEAVCMQMMSPDASCRQVPACRDGRCVLVEPPGTAKTVVRDGGTPAPSKKTPVPAAQPATR